MIRGVMLAMRRRKGLAIWLCLALVLSGVCVFPSARVSLAAEEAPIDDLDRYVGEETLEKDHMISGRVSLSDGRPAIAQEVRLEKQIQFHTDFDQTRTAWVTYDTATTDENGEYRIPVASYRVYRLAAGGSLSAHSDSVWINDNDATINLTVAFHSLQGILRTVNGAAVPNTNITIQRIGDVPADTVGVDRGDSPVSEEMITYSDTVTDSSVELDPVRESVYVDDMQTVLTDSEGVFTYGELPPGEYLIIIGHTGLIARRFFLTGNDFVLVSIGEEQALAEEYRDGILEDEEEDYSEDYGTELDLPGSLLPTPTPSSDPAAIPNMNGPRLFDGKTVYTDYAYSLEDYAMLQYRNVPRVSYETYLSLVNPAMDTTRNMKFLRVDSYRPVNEEAFTKLYQSMIESYCRAVGKDPSESVLYGKAGVILNCAKKYEIDPIFLTTQTFHESAYGTSHLASGITINQVAGPGYPRDVHGKFITRALDKPVTVYNLYGIKAFDSDPVVGGTSYAYYSGWTTPTKALEGAAKYLHDNYIYGNYNQNTPFKIRFSFEQRIWHQYATGPTYAEDIARYMISMASVYSIKAKFVYDLPRYKPSSVSAEPETEE